MRRQRLARALGGAVAVVALGLAVPLTAGTATAASAPEAAGSDSTAGPGRLSEAFDAAAARTGVPRDVLAAWSYAWTRWEGHAGQPSLAGGYGPMHLTDVSALEDARGEGEAPATSGQDTLARASALTGLSRTSLRTDEEANVEGAAALLAATARDLGHGDLPSDLPSWAPALARVAGGGAAGDRIADDVLRTLGTGAARTTSDGQRVSLPAHPGVAPAAKHAAGEGTECPADLDCEWVAAAYAQNSDSKRDYGDYDYADRPRDLRIRYIVIHDTEESYDGTVATFTNPRSYVTAHYVVRSGDGHVAQMVRTKDVAWHAGSWYTNMHSIGIEHEGFAELGGTWYTEPMYRSSAELVRYLAQRFDIPLDRQHVIGHEDVQALTANRVAGMHWDPGPYWDWAHYMDLLGAPLRLEGGPRAELVTIAPDFTANRQSFASCGSSGTLAPQPSNDVALRTAPSTDAPLISDPSLQPSGTPGTTRICDWGDKAVTGQQFAVAGRSGDWTAIWFDGRKAWFLDPADHRAALPGRGRLVSPRPGLDSVPVYGKAYPEASAYPSDIPVQDLSPLQYRLAAGQSYVLGDVLQPDYYYAKTIDSSIPLDHTVVRGQETYLQIQLGHRLGYVKASDVVVRPATG